MSRIQIFSPPSSCFTSPWTFSTTTDIAAGTVYVTASVGCPPSIGEQGVTYAPLPQCCGQFSPVGNVSLLQGTSQICPEGYGYYLASTYAGATTASCCPTVGGFAVDPTVDLDGNIVLGTGDPDACTITYPATTATGTDYVTVTITIAQTLTAIWNQAVLNGLGTTPLPVPANSAAPTTNTPQSSPKLVPSLVLSPVSTTDTPYSTPAHSAFPTWSGSGTLLQGYCTTPQYAILDGPTAYWAPIVGCAGGKSDCCPYSVASPTVVTVVSTVTVNVGPSGTSKPYAPDLQGYPIAVNPSQATLARCPADYVTISGGCCPSEYQLWNAPLGGQVPCYSSISSYLVPPAIDIPNINSPSIESTISVSASSTTNQKPTSAIINIIFAIQFPVQPASSPKSSTSTGAGTGARARVGGLAIIGLAHLLW